MNKEISKTTTIKIYNVNLLGKTYPSAKLFISNKEIVEDLINLGCVPKKSLILKFPGVDIVPKNLIHHFIRGYFDGDGCITCWNLDKNPGYKVSLVGTENFLNSVQDVLSCSIENYRKVKLYKKQSTEAYELTKGGKSNIRKIYDYLYKDSTVYLERKKIKFENIFATNCRSRTTTTEVLE